MTRCSSMSSPHISFHAEARQWASVVNTRRAMILSTSVSGRSTTSARPSEPSSRSTASRTKPCSTVMTMGAAPVRDATVAQIELVGRSACTRDHIPCSTSTSSSSVAWRSSLESRVAETRPKVSAARLRRSWCSALNLTVRRKSTTRTVRGRRRAAGCGDGASSLSRAASTSALTASSESWLIGPSQPAELALEERQDVLRQLVGLREHRRAGLAEDLALGHVDRFLGHVDVADARLGGDQVLLVDADVRQRVLEAVLDRTEDRALLGDRVDRGIDLVDVLRARGRQLVDGRVDDGPQRDGADADRLAVVGADLEGDGGVRREQLDAVELRRRAEALDLGGELEDLALDRLGVVRGERAVLVLHGELSHALQHRMDLVERAFSGLHHGDAVLKVALRLGEAADLAAHLLGDGEAGGVVGGPVDPVAGAQALHGLRQPLIRRLELTVGVEGLDVVLDAKRHCGVLVLFEGRPIWSAAPLRS